MMCLFRNILLEYQKPFNSKQFDTSFDKIDRKM